MIDRVKEEIEAIEEGAGWCCEEYVMNTVCLEDNELYELLVELARRGMLYDDKGVDENDPERRPDEKYKYLPFAAEIKYKHLAAIDHPKIEKEEEIGMPKRVKIQEAVILLEEIVAISKVKKLTEYSPIYYGFYISLRNGEEIKVEEKDRILPVSELRTKLMKLLEEVDGVEIKTL